MCVCVYVCMYVYLLSIYPHLSILTNKVLKHGFIAEMENILDKDTKKSHENIAASIEEILLDPTKIGVKIASESVDSCYSPIIQVYM